MLYAAFGVASPFLPAFVSSRGIPPEQLGLILAAGTATRIVAGPVAARIGDLTGALRAVLAICAAAAGCVVFGYLPAHTFGAFLALSLMQAVALSPVTLLADALALGSAGVHRFDYGWVRGTGSAAFIAGLILAGQAVSAIGLPVIIGLQAMLLIAAALAGLLVPELRPSSVSAEARAPIGGVAALLRMRSFRRVIIVAALVLGSHAMNDGFTMIRWREAGIGAETGSFLWAESVAAEVFVFFLVGPWLIDRLSPAGALALSAIAGVVRWGALATSTALPLLALVQPLHGLTFALLHLACMRLIARLVPPGLAGTAQALYGPLGTGIATALMTLVSGFLYARVGAHGFWFMAALCAAALPLCVRLRSA